MLTIISRVSKAFMLGLAAVTLLSGCSPPGARALLAGKKLLEGGDYQGAAEQFKLATVLLGNTNAQAFNYLGLASHQAGQTVEAERAYRRALALNPDLAEARYNLGCLFLAENKLDQAKAELTAYTLRQGKSIDGWLRLGAAQLRSRDFLGADKSFGEALRLGPQDPEALTGLGLVRLQHNRSAREAADFFSRALKAQPDYRPALLNLAVVAQENLKDRQLALRAYRTYLNLKPPGEKYDAVKVVVAQLEQELAPPAVAAAVVTVPTAPMAVTSNPPRSALAEVPRSGTPARNSNVESSKPTQVAKSEPTNNLTKAAVQTNVTKPLAVQTSAPPPGFEVVKLSPEPAVRSAEDVTLPANPPRPIPKETPVSAPTATQFTPASKPTKRSLLQRLNPVNLFTGDGKTSSPSNRVDGFAATTQDPLTGSDVAGRVASPVREAAPRYKYRAPGALEAGNRAEAEPFFAQGARAQQAQQLPEAIQAYRRAAELDPSFFDAQYNLGLAAFHEGNWSLALSAYENSLAILPESAEARYNFALALKRANYPVDAANELEKLLAIYPNDSRAHLALGNLYAQQLGQSAKARLHYRKLLELDPRNSQAPAVQYWLMANPK